VGALRPKIGGTAAAALGGAMVLAAAAVLTTVSLVRSPPAATDWPGFATSNARRPALTATEPGSLTLAALTPAGDVYDPIVSADPIVPSLRSSSADDGPDAPQSLPLIVVTPAVRAARDLATDKSATAEPRRSALHHAHRHRQHANHHTAIASAGRAAIAPEPPADAPAEPAAAPSGFGFFFGHKAFGGADLVSEARRWLGTNPTGLTSLWCARFMNFVLQRTGHPGSGSDLARSFSSYGQRIAGPRVGAIAVMARGDSGGHVGVVSGIDDSGNPIIISGNYSHTVAEATISRGRILAYVLPASLDATALTQLSSAEDRRHGSE
jgi:uncharacterized protein (TIGR02594 family)